MTTLVPVLSTSSRLAFPAMASPSWPAWAFGPKPGRSLPRQSAGGQLGEGRQDELGFGHVVAEVLALQLYIVAKWYRRSGVSGTACHGPPPASILSSEPRGALPFAPH